MGAGITLIRSGLFPEHNWLLLEFVCADGADSQIMWTHALARATTASPTHCCTPLSNGRLFRCETASVPISFLNKDLVAPLICAIVGTGRHSCSRVGSKFQSDTDGGMGQGSNREVKAPFP